MLSRAARKALSADRERATDRSRRARASCSGASLVNALPAAIYVTDAAGRITFYNEAAAALWGCKPETRQERVVRLVEALLAGRHAAAARRMSDGGDPEDRPAGAGRGSRGRAARWHARAVHALPDAAARRIGQARRRREHAGRPHRVQARRARRAAAGRDRRSPPTTRSSARTSTASSPAGTAPRSGCSAIGPRRSSASPSPSSSRPTATTRSPAYSSASGAASASTTTRPFAAARTEAWSTSR